jgi:pSer/pThr/pTyr-binding forkhead associated (FHA) protein
VVEVKKRPGNPYSDRISLGRARNCDVVLRDPSISKLHAHFRSRDGQWELVDLESQNGTCKNGTPLASHTPELVVVGDLLLFGQVQAKLVDAGLLHDFLK